MRAGALTFVVALVVAKDRAYAMDDAAARAMVDALFVPGPVMG